MTNKEFSKQLEIKTQKFVIRSINFEQSELNPCYFYFNWKEVKTLGILGTPNFRH